MRYDVAIIGGFGHVGLPLALAFADQGKRVCTFDIDEHTGQTIASGRMPFYDEGADEALSRVLASGKLELSLNPESISQAETVIIVTGTPVDRHLNPEFEAMRELVASYMQHFRDGQLIVLRSTVYPGTTEKLRQWFLEAGRDVELAFCPERIAQGVALREIASLPQIVSGFSRAGVERASALFRTLTEDIIELTPIEAELAKLFNNVWRYIKFASANQFFAIAAEHSADFYRIHHAMTYRYQRAQDFPTPGFTAGPCLFKDAMQLAAFNNHTFYLGHAAMLVNEGLPNFLVDKLKTKYPLRDLTVGILGMTFKADCDDARESLSFKLKKILLFESRKVLCSDAYIEADDLVSAEELLRESDIVILGAPHSVYRGLRPVDDGGKVFVDVWNFWGRGCVL
jgi:UDP-N-acetyl-D-mannosaminuronic acid dehydrogenase